MLAVGINATILPLNGTETDSDKIEATSAKYEHKKIFFINILCLEPPYH